MPPHLPSHRRRRAVTLIARGGVGAGASEPNALLESGREDGDDQHDDLVASAAKGSGSGEAVVVPDGVGQDRNSVGFVVDNERRNAHGSSPFGPWEHAVERRGAQGDPQGLGDIDVPAEPDKHLESSETDVPTISGGWF